MDAAQILEFRAFADELADAARGAILPLFRSDYVIEAKAGKRPGFDPVTEADRAAEIMLRGRIEARYPDHGIIGEEYEDRPARGPYTWILDPIDGTRAFIAGLPLWGVLIALAHEGRPVLGVIDQPYLAERFSGWATPDERGAQLATRDGVRALQVRACAALTDATLATTDGALFSGAEAGAFAQVRAAAKLTRLGCDCYAYAMLALGAIDVVIESGLAPWDVAALMPIVEGAGGAIADWRGAALAPNWFLDRHARAQIIACGDGRVRDEALIALKRAAD